MKIKLIILISLIALFVSNPQNTLAEENNSQSHPAPLCLPNAHMETSEDCQLLGPSEYFSRMKDFGIFFPIRSLPAQSIEESYSELPFFYRKLQKVTVPVYTSMNDAISRVNPHHYIEEGFNYVSYIQRGNEGKYYMIDQGIWIRGGDTAGGAANSTFRGLKFAGTPKNKFGWIMSAVETQSTPGFNSPELTGHTLQRYDVIEVYETRETDGVNWLLIGPDEWIEYSNSFAALVYPTSTPPEGVVNGRWIEINLFEQTVSVYENNRLIFATLVSTGIDGWWTRPGLFQITEKLEATPMSGAFEADRSDYYYLEDVPWTMYFDQSRALHGAYWHNYFGYERSHGCVNLSPGDSRWLYGWAQIGDFVYIWDPSGETPTDPSLYTEGGA